jgi:ATP-dependent DNA helicase PIF1
LEDDEGRAEFARRWGFSITAMNPEPNRVMMQGEANVLIIELFEHEQPTFDTLSRIVNRVQRHACSEAYCLRRKKLPGGVLSIEPVCRFYFPRRHHEEAYVTRDMNPAYWMFDGARNDSHLNGYNRTITLGWLANTDIKPCISIDAVLNYVAKYCSKAETKSKSYQELASELLPRISNRDPLVSFASKLMNKLISERDWSVQEICHLLMHLPLQEGTRVVGLWIVVRITPIRSP